MKMKKVGLLLLFALFFSFSHAQKSDFRFGLKASPSLVWLKPDTKGVASDGSKLTFSWGFLAEYYFADNYAIASGVDVISRGGKLSILDTLHNVYKTKYIEVPITVKMRTNEIGYIRYFGQFGFTPGLNFRSKGDTKTQTINNTDVDIKSDINSVNIALTIGLGIEYSLGGNTALIVSANFNNGFTDIAKSKDYKVISNYVALNVGVLF